MLSGAQREREAGRDVMIGVVETHGRTETAALLAGLEQLPPRRVPYRGRTLDEFDLDAALARHPALLLVDELAHSNAPGSRHAKRWQDVQELLDAGIDVWTTLNVQHLESLNGTVGAITGVRVHETVPDAVLDSAQEVLLIDVTPDELLRRLNAGKVYLPRQAERALQNFFRKGNLIALREIALRRTAEHVEGDVRDWRVEQSAGTGSSAPPVWNTSGAILAAVDAREDAAQTVRRAARLAGQLSVAWHAVHVETPRLRRQGAAQHERALAVLKLAEELGAQTAVLSGSDVAQTLAAEAQRLNCAIVVLGQPDAGLSWRRVSLGLIARGGVARALARCAPALDVVSVGEAPSARRLSLPGASALGAALAAPSWPAHVWALGASVLTTLIALLLGLWLESSNIVMLYLLCVVGVALRFGRGPAALAALLNVAAFDFFFIRPRMSFAVSDVQYLLTFAIMLGVGLLVGQLTAGLRFAADVSSTRERRARSLFELSRELSAALQGEQIAQFGADAVGRFFGCPALVLAANAQDRLALPAPLPDGLDASVADWVFAHGQSAGLGTATLAAQRWHYVPLRAPMRVRGVLALAPADSHALLVPEQARQLDALARQIAIALERVHYVEVAQQAVVEIESERLRGALLGAISHDVRTPLTALITLAESLQALPPGPHSEAARAIERQARALHALVSNLLDMAGLEGGAVNLRRAWQSGEEVVGSAIRAARAALGGLTVRTALAPDLPLGEFDAVLIERVLVNLLENAAKYGAPPIVVSAHATADALVLAVRDHGAGLPAALAGREQALFDKFTRGQSESATPGVGLGLAICKAVITAHGGTIAAANAPFDAEGGGAQLTITLPRHEPPVAEAAEQPT
jgi:two-component system sensor histidine kinase KdpD